MSTEENKDKLILTDFEMETVNSIRTRSQQVFFQLGQISVERRSRMAELDDMEESLLQQYTSIVEEESNFFEKLREKYGDGTLNPNTGEFIPR